MGNRKTNVLLATNILEVDEFIEESGKFNICGKAYYREAVKGFLERTNPEIAVISSALSGGADLYSVIADVRSCDIRVVYIDWNPEPDREFLAKIIQLGVYDIVTNPVSLPLVVEKIERPSSYSQAVSLIGIEPAVKPFFRSSESEKAVTEPQEWAWAEGEKEETEEFEETESKPEAVSFEREPGGEAGFADFPEADGREGLNYFYALFGDFCRRYESAETFADNFSENEKPDVLILPEKNPLTKTLLQALRRLSFFESVYIIVVGVDEDPGVYYGCGADEVVPILSEEVVKRAKKSASRLKELWEKASLDSLTGLYNRGFMDVFLKDVEGRYRGREKGLYFSIALIDLDHFKKINDEHGHAAGDEVLSRFASFLKESLRETDLAFRYGGEEFLVFFRGAVDAFSIMQRLKEAWKKSKGVLNLEGGEVKTSFSAGTACFNTDAETVEELIKKADRALYEAKNTGRDRVVSCLEVSCSDSDSDFSTAQVPQQMLPAADEENDEWVYAVGPEEEAHKKIPPHPFPFERCEEEEEEEEEKEYSCGEQKKEKAFSISMQGIGVLSGIRAVRVIKEKTDKIKTVRSQKPELQISLPSVNPQKIGETVVKSIRLGEGFFSRALHHKEEKRDGRAVGIAAVASLGSYKDAVEVSYLLKKHLEDSGGTVSIIDEKEIDSLDRALRLSGTVLFPVKFKEDASLEAFLTAAERADVFLWIVPENFTSREVSLWKKRPLPCCREVGVVFAKEVVDIAEEAFLIPFVFIDKEKPEKWLKKLLSVLEKTAVQKGTRILAVGFKKLPCVAGIIFDSFASPEEASLWLENNNPFAAVISPALGMDSALLEYDLLKKGIPFHKGELETCPFISFASSSRS